MDAPIAWYAHHHGAGHVTRARILTTYLTRPVALFTSRPAGTIAANVAALQLPLDVQTPQSAWHAGQTQMAQLHYTPVGIDGLRTRMATMAQWAGNADPAPTCAVVDVSAEVALFWRLLSVPVVYMRQRGWRDDPGHRLAYEAASAMCAPFPEVLEDPDTPEDIRGRTHYLGAFSRFGDRDHIDQVLAKRAVGQEDADKLVVVLSGDGGTARWGISDAARTTPDWRWLVLGNHSSAPSDPVNVAYLGWIEDPWTILQAADVVITHAGQNALSEIAAAARPAIVVAQPRPFNEQIATASRLGELGVCEVAGGWPAAKAWSRLLGDAVTRGSRGWKAVSQDSSVHRAAGMLEQLFRTIEGRPPGGEGRPPVGGTS